MELEMKKDDKIRTLTNELTISEHVKNGWRNFSEVKLQDIKKLEDRLKLYEKSLNDIANFMENWEDYYGGVGINYHEMINSIIKLAKTTLEKGKK